jgi:hypothetical protein
MRLEASPGGLDADEKIAGCVQQVERQRQH